MIKKVAFLEGRLLSSQSEQSEKFSKSPDWLSMPYQIFFSASVFCILNLIPAFNFYFHQYLLLLLFVCIARLFHKFYVVCSVD